MENSTCRNCGDTNVQDFCPKCGEKRYQRIAVKNVLGDFLSNLFTLEGPVLRTIKDLTIRPGKFIDDYLKGKRKAYYKPFQFYILAATVYFIFFFMWGEDMLNMFSDLGTNSNNSVTIEEAKKFEQEILEFQNRNMRILTFFQVPIYAWLIWLSFRRKSGHSFTESFVVSLYLFAQLLLFGVIFTLFAPLHPELSFTAMMIFSFVYCAWVLVQLYKEKIGVTLLKSIAISTSVIVLYSILMLIITMVWILLVR